MKLIYKLKVENDEVIKQGEDDKQFEDEFQFNENILKMNSNESTFDAEVSKPLMTIPMAQAAEQVQSPEAQIPFRSNTDISFKSGEIEEFNEKVQEFNFSQEPSESKLINIANMQDHFNAITHHILLCEQATALVRENKETIRILHRNTGHSGAMDMATQCKRCGIPFIWDSMNVVQMEYVQQF